MSPVQRTIAMPVLLAGSIFIAVFFSACSDRIKTDINVFKALDESLVNSNKKIINETETVLISLKDKLAEPATAQKAKIWFPKAKYIESFSRETNEYIEAVKIDLKKAAGSKKDEGVESFRENDKNAVVRLFDKEGKGEELYNRLQKYKEDVFSVDSTITEVFREGLIFTTSSFDSTGNKKDFTKTFFDDLPTIAALAMLSKFQNNISISENKAINFCHNQIVSYPIHWWPTAFVGQNINYSRPGQTIEITAGIANFTASLNTEIIIFKKGIPINEYGIGIHKFKASDTPGKHTVPVEISFVDQEGKKQTITKNVEYTVAQ